MGNSESTPSDRYSQRYQQAQHTVGSGQPSGRPLHSASGGFSQQFGQVSPLTPWLCWQRVGKEEQLAQLRLCDSGTKLFLERVLVLAWSSRHMGL